MTHKLPAPGGQPTCASDPAISRRALLSALPAVGAAVAIAPAALAQTAAFPGIDGAIAAYRDADARFVAFDKNTFLPVHRTWRHMCEAIPHVTTTNTFNVIPDGPKSLSTEDPGVVNIAKKAIEDAIGTHAADTDFTRACRELVEAAEARDAIALRFKSELGLDELEAEYDRLSDAADNALVAVEEYPVRTASDLTKKIELIQETGGEHPTEPLLADLRRIVGLA